MYYIIEKIQFNGGKLNRTKIGYSQDKSFCGLINNQYDETLGKFIKDNYVGISGGYVSLNVFFSGTPIVYEARIQVEKLTDNLKEISDLTEL